MKKTLLILPIVLAIVAGIVHATTPDTLVFGNNGALAYVRPCSHKGVTPIGLVSGANGAVGSTGVMPNGVFTVTCLNKACFGQAATAVAAIAASVNTHCNQLSANTPYWFLAEGTDYIAVTGASGETESTCGAAECR